MSFDPMIIILIALFALIYFMMIRPQQKRMREHQEMQSRLAEGDRVLLTSGIFATIAHVGEQQLIVELAPGTEVTILKGNVARKANSSEEEFEFADDIEEAEVTEPEATGATPEPEPSEETQVEAVREEGVK